MVSCEELGEVFEFLVVIVVWVGVVILSNVIVELLLFFVVVSCVREEGGEGRCCLGVECYGGDVFVVGLCGGGYWGGFVVWLFVCVC